MTGPDGIPGRVWRTCAEQLSGALTDIFNLSLAQAIVPMCLKTTTITPLPKQSKPDHLNERSVGLTHLLTKCLEKLILAHLKPISILAIPMLGCYSSTSAQLRILDFLINRQQTVRFNNLSSTTLPLITGLPQGCVLSPLLHPLHP